VRVLGVVLVTGLIAGPLFTQSATTPEFDVVSIKPTTPSGAFGYPPPAPGQWKNPEATLVGLIRVAQPDYAAPGLIIGGPPWVRENLFDVNARVNPSASPEAVREMVKRMLAERFDLRTHVEQRTLDVYLLKMARADGSFGPSLSRSRPECVAERGQRRLRSECFPSRPTPNAIMMPTSDMSQLARMIASAQVVRRPVIDRTALTGFFDLQLPFADALPTQGDAAGVSFFTAIQEQLGLKLESSREVMDVLVIDSARLPEPD
jgi:uncharacterized protein (TIGR03435 family)